MAGSDPRAPEPHVLRDYALIADGQRGALVDPDGNLAWMCFPRWHDPAVFAGLWGGGGRYCVRPEGRAVWGGSYDYGSLVWVSRWATEDGVVESRDALAYPGDERRAVVLRRVTVSGEPQVVVAELALADDYGLTAVQDWERGGDVWHLRGGRFEAWWSPAAPVRVARYAGGRRALRSRFWLRPGEHLDLALVLAAPGAGGPLAPEELERTWQETEYAWRRVVPASVPALAERDVRHAVAVLRGLTAPNGASVAAATASLPEHAREGRDYDYRYAWIRDCCYLGQAGAALGQAGEALLDDAVRFVASRLREDGAGLMPAYTVDGDPVPEPSRIELPGYPGGHDVVGNQVRHQFQLDGLGEALLLLAAAARADRLDADGWQAGAVALEAVEKRWQQPDAGMWELDDHFWAQSRLSCVAGIQAICKADAPAEWSSRYLPLADRILAETAASCVHPTGRWQRASDDPRVDASLLLPAIRGAVPIDDPRSRATASAVVEDLVRDGYVFRYRHGEHQLGDDEGAFLICSFWLTMHCVASGLPVEAARFFERARASCGTPGLLAEEFDVDQRQLAGNLPQAFVHAALIEAAVAQAAAG